MTTRIYFFTGTGNSLWAARRLAGALGAGDPVPLVRALGDREVRPDAERVGLVVPVYMYRLPHLVVDFVERLETPGPVFVVATGGGDPGDLFVHVARQFARRGLDLAQGLFVAMPSNYIPFGGAPEAPVVAERISAAATRLDGIAATIARGERVIDRDHSRFRAWVHPGLLYRLGYRYAPVTDKRYQVEETCDGCGICARVCPVDNITITDARPRWQSRCLQCMACLQWCPKEAIQVQDKTRGERRYHHPEVKLKDVIAQKPGRG